MYNLESPFALTQRNMNKSFRRNLFIYLLMCLVKTLQEI